MRAWRCVDNKPLLMARIVRDTSDTMWVGHSRNGVCCDKAGIHHTKLCCARAVDSFSKRSMLVRWKNAMLDEPLPGGRNTACQRSLQVAGPQTWLVEPSSCRVGPGCQTTGVVYLASTQAGSMLLPVPACPPACWWRASHRDAPSPQTGSASRLARASREPGECLQAGQRLT